jgi:pimeloyl-ACP methyl ester carboxylesterase
MQARPSPQMDFSAVAPHLRQSKRFTSLAQHSGRFVTGVATAIFLILLGIGLIYVFSRINPPNVAVDSNISASLIEERTVPEAATHGYLKVEQVQLYYEMMGSGPPLVLIHDALLHREVWDKQFETFARDYTVIRYDQRGYGLSDFDDMGYVSIEDLHALLEFLDIDSATLVGSSYGGQMALDFALAYPDMVDALVLVGAPISGSSFSQNDADAYIWRRVVFGRYFGQFRPSGRLHNVDEAKEAIDFWFGFPSSRYWILPENADIRQSARNLLLANLQNLIHRRLIKEPESPANGRLATIQVPVLIIVGQGDNPDLHEHATKLETGIAGASKVVIPNAGHLVHLEQPKAFNQAVLGFLQQR